MKCPIDGATLAMTERHGVEIDYCPECRGVWLDRGELDRIIDDAIRTTPRPDSRHDQEERGQRDSHHDGDWDRDAGGRRRKSPLSMLGDLLGGGE